MDKPVNTPMYHDGEIRVQTRAGMRDTANRNGRMISNAIPKGAVLFVEQQIMAVFGSVDENGQLWCSVIFGQPGFIHAPNVNTLEINTQLTGITTVDPFWRNIKTQPQVGLLLIELSTRRRLRINGQLINTAEHLYTLDIQQAYPNCPKYIQRRHSRRAQAFSHPGEQVFDQGTTLLKKQRKIISAADTFFVASAQRDANSQYHVDASHRGGQPGFVEIIDEHQLRIPDFVGNSMFNTLGNFDSYPHTGLLFIDFEQRQLLQLTGRPKILWNHDAPVDTTGGTQRYWQLTIECWQLFNIPFDIDWEFLDYSPVIPSYQGR